MPNQERSVFETKVTGHFESKLKIKSAPASRSLSDKKLATYPDACQFLSSLPEFSGISAEKMKTLADSCHFASIEPGQYLTSEGDDAGSCGFIVVAGSFAMLKRSTSGKELIVELLQSGDIYGLLMALGAARLPEQLSARSLEKSQVLWVPLSTFSHLLAAHPAIYQEFNVHLLLCLQAGYRLSRGLAHDRVEVRIATILSSLALKFARPMASEKAHTIYFTRQQLADLTGTTPETAIRVTRAMQSEGLIDIKRPGVIRIIDTVALLRLAEE